MHSVFQQGTRIFSNFIEAKQVKNITGILNYKYVEIPIQYLCVRLWDLEAKESGRHSTCFKPCISTLYLHAFLITDPMGSFKGRFCQLWNSLVLWWAELNGKNIIRVCSTLTKPLG